MSPGSSPLRDPSKFSLRLRRKITRNRKSFKNSKQGYHINCSTEHRDDPN